MSQYRKHVLLSCNPAVSGKTATEIPDIKYRIIPAFYWYLSLSGRDEENFVACTEWPGRKAIRISLGYPVNDTVLPGYSNWQPPLSGAGW